MASTTETQARNAFRSEFPSQDGLRLQWRTSGSPPPLRGPNRSTCFCRMPRLTMSLFLAFVPFGEA